MELLNELLGLLLHVKNIIVGLIEVKYLVNIIYKVTEYLGILTGILSSEIGKDNSLKVKSFLKPSEIKYKQFLVVETIFLIMWYTSILMSTVM